MPLASTATIDTTHSAARADNGNTSAEWAFLLQCTSRNGATAQTIPGLTVDWPLLFRLAERHGVLGLLASRVQDVSSSEVPPRFLSQLNEYRREHSKFTLQLTAQLFRIMDAFQSRGLSLLLTKGPALSVRCYGDPATRQYTDLDLIIRHRDIGCATEVMLDLGYTPTIPLSTVAAGKTPGEYNFTKAGTSLLMEFHTERTFRYHPRPIAIEKVFARSGSLAIDGRAVPVLSLADELILISVHAAKHLWERLLWVADVAALAQHPALDWDRVNAVAEEVRAQRILHLALRLAADVLFVPLPPSVDAAVRQDKAVARVAAQLAARLAAAQPEPVGLIERAAFRVQMRGSMLDGLAYLLRLSLSPTEEDWRTDGPQRRSTLADALARPLRLMKKHRAR